MKSIAISRWRIWQPMDEMRYANMSAVELEFEATLAPVLQQAIASAQAEGLPYAGSLPPVPEAHRMKRSMASFRDCMAS